MTGTLQTELLFFEEKHDKNISDMPKRCKIVRLLRRYTRLYRELLRTELELSQIMKQCPEATSCFLRYGPYLRVPYGCGHPVEYDIEEWQIVLADFYTEQANKLLGQREQILKKLWAMASRIYKLRGNGEVLSSRFPHLRKPNFYSQLVSTSKEK